MSNLINRITFNPDICGGRPCLRDTRVRVKDILELLSAGATTTEILEDYPYLDAEDISAALAFAATYLDHTVLRAAA